MIRRWRRITLRRRTARLKFKQHPMTPSSSPIREVSGQEEDLPDVTITTPECHPPSRPDPDEEPQPKDHPADQISVHNQSTHAEAELEGLSLKIDNFTRDENEAVEAGSDGEGTKDTYASQAQPTSPFDDPEEGSQSSSEESWASFPSSSRSSSFSADNSGNSSTDEQEEKRDDGECAPETVDIDGGPLPSPETTFKFYKFHEEFKDLEEQDDEEEDDDDDDNDDPRFSPTGPWASSAVPRWAFLRSSNSLPVLNLGPGDFYHGGSALRHEVSADEDWDEDEDDYAESRGTPEIAMVGVVHL